MTLEDILAEDDEDFVAAAYLALLKRRPDAIGGTAYLKDLRSGKSKLQILYELHSSDESRHVGGDIGGLADAFSRERLGEPASAAAAAAHIRDAGQLLETPDIDLFVALAYRLLLQRPADPTGAAQYREQLEAGASRLQILFELHESSERRAKGTRLAGLLEEFGRVGLTPADDGRADHVPSGPVSVDELFALDGESFVEAAYASLMQRPPTADAARRELARLCKGESRLQLLVDLASATRRTPSIRGFAPAARALRLARLPFVGGLLGAVLGVESDSAAARGERGARERLRELTRALEERQRALESGLEARVSSMERSVSVLRELNERYIADAVSGADAVAPTRSSARMLLDAKTEEVFRDLRNLRD
jgi:Domain of unknown function (DUF4214)